MTTCRPLLLAATNASFFRLRNSSAGGQHSTVQVAETGRDVLVSFPWYLNVNATAGPSFESMYLQDIQSNKTYIPHTSMRCTCYGRRGNVETGCYDVSGMPDLLKHVLGGEAALWGEESDGTTLEAGTFMAAAVVADRAALVSTGHVGRGRCKTQACLRGLYLSHHKRQKLRQLSSSGTSRTSCRLPHCNRIFFLLYEIKDATKMGTFKFTGWFSVFSCPNPSPHVRAQWPDNGQPSMH